MLVTGEIVPRTGPALEFTRTPSALVFSWEGDYRLLTSTNLKGPYVVITASSPYIQLPTEPQRFFLLTSP